MIPYSELERHFTLPSVIGFSNNKLPRKLKKKVKAYNGVSYNLLSNSQRLWSYLGYSNPDYKRFLIKIICNKYN